jgi:hypothetical protein
MIIGPILVYFHTSKMINNETFIHQSIRETLLGNIVKDTYEIFFTNFTYLSYMREGSLWMQNTKNYQPHGDNNASQMITPHSNTS